MIYISRYHFQNTYRNIPKKMDMETAVVSKLTPVIDAMRELGAETVINMYLNFITNYLSDISKINPSDLWQVISTDFKIDNIIAMKFYITDFTPARDTGNGTFYVIRTPVFVLGANIPDFRYNGIYTTYQISKITYEIFFLCMLTSLYFMTRMKVARKLKITHLIA